MDRFNNPRSIDSPNPSDDAERMQILMELGQMTAFAVQGKIVIIRTPKGYCHLEAKDDGKLVNFTWAGTGKTPVCFWFNASSVTSISKLLKESPTLRVPFANIFAGE